MLSRFIEVSNRSNRTLFAGDSILQRIWRPSAQYICPDEAEQDVQSSKRLARDPATSRLHTA